MSPIDPPVSDSESDEPSSLAARLFNVFAAPAEVFDELRAAPPAHGNWIVPLLLSMGAGILFSVVAFSQPDILSGVAAQQEAALAARVEAGQMTAEQADQTLEAMRRFSSPRVMMLFGSVGSVIGSGLFLVVLALLLWVLASKILGGGTSLMKAFELAGLACMIHVAGSLVTLTLVLLRGDVQAGLNPGLFLESFRPADYGHQLLIMWDAVTLWYLAILSLGVSRLTGRSSRLTAAWIFGFWLVVRGALALGSAWWAGKQAGL